MRHKKERSLHLLRQDQLQKPTVLDWTYVKPNPPIVNGIQKLHTLV